MMQTQNDTSPADRRFKKLYASIGRVVSLCVTEGEDTILGAVVVLRGLIRDIYADEGVEDRRISEVNRYIDFAFKEIWNFFIDHRNQIQFFEAGIAHMLAMQVESRLSPLLTELNQYKGGEQLAIVLRSTEPIGYPKPAKKKVSKRKS